MQTPMIRGTSRTDLLALPAIMLGFHPEQSCVVLALDGPAVRFCLRADLDWFASDFDRVAEQIVNAAGRAGATDFVLIGFGDTDLASIVVAELSDLLGDEHVLEALVADGHRFWSINSPGDPVGYRFDTSSVAAQAVYQGVNVSPDRDTVIVPVTVGTPPAEHVVLAAEQWVARLGPDQGMALLATLAEADALQPNDALLLVVLLADEERFAELLTRLKTWTAERYWARLVEARAVCPARFEPNLLALLAIASWLSGRGAAHTSCLEQLSLRAPSHPVLGMLHRLHRNGVPPRKWDE